MVQGDEYMETLDTQEALSFANDADTDPIGIVNEDYIDGAGTSQIPHILLFAMPLPDPQYRTYCVIKALCMQNGQEWWSIYSLASLRNKSVETIRIHLEDLQHCGLIRKKIIHTKGGNRTAISLCKLETVFAKIMVDALRTALWGKRVNDIEADLLPIAERYAEALHGGVKPKPPQVFLEATPSFLGKNPEKLGNHTKKTWSKELIKRINKEERGPHVPSLEELAGKLPPLIAVPQGSCAGGLSSGNGNQVRKEQLARDRAAKREQTAAAKVALDAVDGRVREALTAFLAGVTNGNGPAPLMPQFVAKHSKAANDLLAAGYTPERIQQAAHWLKEKWAKGGYTVTPTNLAEHIGEWDGGSNGSHAPSLQSSLSLGLE